MISSRPEQGSISAFVASASLAMAAILRSTGARRYRQRCRFTSRLGCRDAPERPLGRWSGASIVAVLLLHRRILIDDLERLRQLRLVEQVVVENELTT